jgi:hypothetical protein
MSRKIGEILADTITVGRVLVIPQIDYDAHTFLVLKTLMEDYGGQYCEGRLYKCFVFNNRFPTEDYSPDLLMKMRMNLHLNKK